MIVSKNEKSKFQALIKLRRNSKILLRFSNFIRKQVHLDMSF